MTHHPARLPSARGLTGALAGLLATLMILLAAPRATGAAPSAPADITRQQSRLVTLPSGVTLNYVVQGDPAGPAIVLLHGVGDSWHSYDLVLPLLPPTVRVYAVTLRGHGWSDHPRRGYERTDFAADISALLAAFDLHHVTLVGHSLGSFVAEQVAADDTGRIDRLVLIGAGPAAITNAELLKSLTAAFTALHDPVDYTFARDFQASTIYAPVPPAFFETLVAEALKVPAPAWHGIARAWQRAEDGAVLRRIRVPTLVLWGDHDEIFSRTDQDTIIKAIPDARLVVYGETGHALHWERPERFADDLLRFVGAP